jgi:hypothetical protein
VLGREKGDVGVECIENPSYSDYKANGYKPVGCGNNTMICTFYGIYVGIVQIIFLNLFMAIILNGYFKARDEASSELNENAFSSFQNAWAQHDPDGTGFIKVKYFKPLMVNVDPPLGWDKSVKDNLQD